VICSAVSKSIFLTPHSRVRKSPFSEQRAFRTTLLERSTQFLALCLQRFIYFYHYLLVMVTEKQYKITKLLIEAWHNYSYQLMTSTERKIYWSFLAINAILTILSIFLFLSGRSYWWVLFVVTWVVALPVVYYLRIRGTLRKLKSK